MGITSMSFSAVCSRRLVARGARRDRAHRSVCRPVGRAPRSIPTTPSGSDDDRAFDASKAVVIEDTSGYDFVDQHVQQPGERRDVRALNVNTVDEVPDSSWFTNRIGRRPMSVAEIVKGPDTLDTVSLDGWIVSGGKSTGLQPGFRMTDPSGQVYQIEVDPPSNPELASGAEMIGTAFYHAIGLQRGRHVPGGARSAPLVDRAEAPPFAIR